MGRFPTVEPTPRSYERQPLYEATCKRCKRKVEGWFVLDKKTRPFKFVGRNGLVHKPGLLTQLPGRDFPVRARHDCQEK